MSMYDEYVSNWLPVQIMDWPALLEVGSGAVVGGTVVDVVL